MVVTLKKAERIKFLLILYCFNKSRKLTSMLEPPLISADILLNSLANVTFFSSFESEEICLVKVLRRGAVVFGTDPGLSMKAVSPKFVSESFKLSMRLLMFSES